MSLTDEAKLAAAARLAKRKAEAQAARRRLRADALAAVLALPRPDGSTLTAELAGLRVQWTDPDAQLVVFTDDQVSIAARFVDDAWRVHVVEQVDGQWTDRGEVLELADLGEQVI